MDDPGINLRWHRLLWGLKSLRTRWGGAPLTPSSRQEDREAPTLPKHLEAQLSECLSSTGLETRGLCRRPARSLSSPSSPRRSRRRPCASSVRQRTMSNHDQHLTELRDNSMIPTYPFVSHDTRRHRRSSPLQPPLSIRSRLGAGPEPRGHIPPRRLGFL